MDRATDRTRTYHRGRKELAKRFLKGTASYLADTPKVTVRYLAVTSQLPLSMRQMAARPNAVRRDGFPNIAGGLRGDREISRGHLGGGREISRGHR